MVLDNRLNLQTSSELLDAEERISKTKAIELFERNLLDARAPGTFETLAFIHGHLFGDIYDFAGKIRSENISKGGFRFAPALYLDDAVRQIERMPQSSYEEIIEKYVEMNVAHPFREGNGRAMRIWLDHMLRESLGLVVDWSVVDLGDYLSAIERSPIKDTEIKVLLKGALTDDIANRQTFVKGLDASYAYEGLDRYKSADL